MIKMESEPGNAFLQKRKNEGTNAAPIGYITSLSIDPRTERGFAAIAMIEGKAISGETEVDVVSECELRDTEQEFFIKGAGRVVIE